jgi:hypothetical protein
MHALIEEGLRERFHRDPRVRATLQAEEQAVAAGRATPLAAAMRVLGCDGAA